ncbi:MAG: OmpA family protein [Ferruginibacter sp.]|nr:OmpA family protein [Chitinophagaceae bacterium]
MSRVVLLLLSIITGISLYSQRTTAMDGDWSKQFLVLKNTPEAALMIRVGDIDNLNFGWEEDFNPFSGKSSASHGFPWEINKMDAKGTDRIMVPGSYKYGSSKASEGYTGTTLRPANLPVPVSIPLQELKTVKIDSASLQLFIDDFQSPTFESKFQLKVNGIRFTEAEKMISKIRQDGPIGKLVTIRLTPELLQKLSGDSLVIYIDDPTTGIGDGFAIDFVKLLINPKNIYKGTIKGRVIDADTGEPLTGATTEVEGFGMVKTDGEGNYILENIPAGLTIVKASASGYAAAEKQEDVVADETTEGVDLELKRSGKVTYNNKALQEGDGIVMNNIQFDVNSAVLLAAGKSELDKLAGLLKENASLEILLSGHTSAEGAAGLNRELSLKRVRSCKDYLASKGIDEGRITIKGFGPDKPIAPNDNEINRAMNRRVELKITKL